MAFLNQAIYDTLALDNEPAGAVFMRIDAEGAERWVWVADNFTVVEYAVKSEQTVFWRQAKRRVILTKYLLR